MNDNSTHNSGSDLAYIKTIMQKSEVNAAIFSRFFLFLALYSVLADSVLWLYMRQLNERLIQNGFAFICQLVLRRCIWKLVAVIPILILIFVFYRKLKQNRQGISLWLFQVLSFVLVFCWAVVPIISVTVDYSQSPGSLFAIITAALCLFLCGIFTDSRFLKRTACIYAAVSMLPLSVMGLYVLYQENCRLAAVSAGFVLFRSYAWTFFYCLYPALAYLLLFFFMRKKSKEVADDEL